MKTPTERFWAKVNKTNTCWLWTGVIQKFGYGMAWDVPLQHAVRAHRKAWELVNGPIPGDLCVLHKCDVRHCVRPAHLFLGTRTDNARDRDLKGRLVKRRPPIGESNPKAKLRYRDVRRIRRMYNSGRYSQEALGRRFGVTQANISSVVRKETWS